MAFTFPLSKVPTQAEIDAYRDQVRLEYAGMGRGFDINSNGYGIRAECKNCHASRTLQAEMWMRNHTCDLRHRPADFEQATRNTDGTVDRVLYFS